MERLTHYDINGKACLIIGNHGYTGHAVDVLAAYEDTGLEPAEIAELKEDLDFAAAANAELYYALPHWISVKEGLPEKGKPVLVYGKRGGIYTALFEGGKYWWKLNSKSHSCEPTHWMPLPEPPPKGAE